MASRQEKAKDLAAWASFSPELPFAYVLFLDPKPTPAPTSAPGKEHEDQPAGWGEAYLLSRGTSLRLHPPVERMTAQRKPPLLPQSPAPGVPGPLGKAEPLCQGGRSLQRPCLRAFTAERALQPASQGAFPNVERSSFRVRGVEAGVWVPGRGFKLVAGKTQKDANTATHGPTGMGRSSN